MLALSIRRVTSNDVAAFEDYMARIFSEDLETLVPRGSPPDPEKTEKYIAQHTEGDSAIFLAEINGHLIGSVALTRLGRPQLDHAVGLGLNVSASFRGKGIGRTLLQHGLQWARQTQTIERIELEVIENNLPALRLYEQQGFIREGVKRRAVKKPNGYLNIYVYSVLTEELSRGH